MKKALILFALCSMLSGAARAEGAAEVSSPTGFFSWSELGTLAGATAATMLIVQFAKLPLDKIWKIPTRLLVLVVSFLLLLLSQIFTVGLTPQALPLIVLNSFVVAAAAMGAYEVTLHSNP